MKKRTISIKDQKDLLKAFNIVEEIVLHKIRADDQDSIDELYIALSILEDKIDEDVFQQEI